MTDGSTQLMWYAPSTGVTVVVATEDYVGTTLRARQTRYETHHFPEADRVDYHYDQEVLAILTVDGKLLGFFPMNIVVTVKQRVEAAS